MVCFTNTYACITANINVEQLVNVDSAVPWIVGVSLGVITTTYWLKTKRKAGFVGLLVSSRVTLTPVRHHRANASQRYAASDDGFLNARRHLIAEDTGNDRMMPRRVDGSFSRLMR